MARKTQVLRTAIAGCFVCNGMEAIWFASNAQGVAARHHDATGHQTWADVTMMVRYGDGEIPITAPTERG